MAVTLSPSGLTLGSTTIADWGDVGGGKVLQVVEGTSTSTTATSSTSFVNTAISTSITPSSTSSKILVIVSAPTESQTNTNVGSGDQTLGLFRGSTEIATTNIGTREANGFYDYVQGGTSMQRLDSPSTTSSTTYTVKIKSNHSSTTIRCPSNSRVGSIILMEIGA